MKTILHFILLIVFLSGLSAGVVGQWVEISPQGSYGDVILYDTYFINDHIGFAVGQDLYTGFGYVFKTVDGGISWTDTTFMDSHLRSIDFRDNNNGIIVGYNNPPSTMTKFFVTTNQGETWTQTTDQTFTGMDGIQFVSPDIAYAYGYGSIWGSNAGIMKTTNGGNSWLYIADNADMLINDMHFTDINTGFFAILNMTTLQSSIQKTSDGGIYYSIIYSGDWILSNYFINNNRGYLIEGLYDVDRKLLTTNDGGNSWTTTNLGEDFVSVYFVDENTGYIYGGGGKIKKTSDAGNTWQSESSGKTNNFEKSACHTENYIFISGNNATVLKSLHGSGTAINTARSDEPGILIYPNPFSEKVTFEIHGKDDIQLQVFNSVGEKIKSYNRNNDLHIEIIDENLKSGVYFYKVLINDKVVKTGKLIKV